MTTLSGSGIVVEVPSGWEGRIYTHEPGGAPPRLGGNAAQQQHASNAIAHIASFPIPPGAGDYGGGAVERMTNKDLLVVLMEHGAHSANTPMFAAQGIPKLTIADVSTTCLQRLIDGQGGAQRFFTVNGRAFCLYVVFGSFARRVRTLPLVNGILTSVSIT